MTDSAEDEEEPGFCKAVSWNRCRGDRRVNKSGPISTSWDTEQVSGTSDSCGLRKVRWHFKQYM